MERLAIAPKTPSINIDVITDRDDLKRPLTRDEMASMTESELQIRDYKVANHKRWQLEETAQMHDIRQ